MNSRFEVEILKASISTASAGDTTVIAGVPGRRIHVRHITLMNTGALENTVIIKDGATAINGAGFALASKAGYAFDAPGPVGHGEIWVATGNGLVLNLSAASQVSGFVLYWLA